MHFSAQKGSISIVEVAMDVQIQLFDNSSWRTCRAKPAINTGTAINTAMQEAQCKDACDRIEAENNQENALPKIHKLKMKYKTRRKSRI